MPAWLEHMPSFGSDDACPKDRFTVVVLGSSCVGKTSIINRLLYRSFDDQHRATIEEFHQEEFELGDVTITLDVIDTTGTYSFPAMRKLCIEKGDAFLLVFSFDDAESFEQIPTLLAQIHELNEKPNRRICIVGNKTDLMKADVSLPVNRQLAESLVLLDWELGYVEVSAKENRNIDDLLSKIVGNEVIPSGTVTTGVSGSTTDRTDYQESDTGSTGETRCKQTLHSRKTSLPPSVLKCRDALIKRNSCIVS